MKLVTWDTETTGVDTDNDRIITCFVRATDNKNVVFEKNWVIDPGVEIPKEASDVHGMSTEWVRENGRKDVEEVIKSIFYTLELAAGDGHIVTGYNNSFDLSILDSEVRRHMDGYKLKLENARYLDPVIFSRKFDKYKKGGHKLITVAQRNGIQIEEDRLHAADYDVEVTERLVPTMLNRAWVELEDERQGMSPDEFITFLQDKQRLWKAEWAEGLTSYFAKQGKTEEDGSPIIVEGNFPW